MENIISPQQIELIKDKIQIELLKRGIHAPIIQLEEHEGRTKEHRIRLKTSEFTTTPTIFKRLWIEQFNTWITRKTHENVEGPVELYSITIGVNYSYEHFGGGTNGCNLFTFHCNLRTDLMEHIFDVEIS